MSPAGILSIAEADAAVERKRRGQSLMEQAEEWSGSLRLFVEHAWAGGEIETGAFVPGWHIDAICEHLEAVSAGEIRRLAVCVPPGSTKSTVTSVCWPVWEWTSRPGRRHITASYDRGLATKFAVQSRTLIASDWFQQRWGKKFSLSSDENMKTEYANTRGGRRISVPTNSTTGRHADVIVIDDPHDAAVILSDAKREDTIEWHDGTITTRFNDPRTGCEVIIAQRLHEKDLIGHVLAKEPGEWTVLCLPERFEARHPYRTPDKVKLPSGRVVRGDPREAEGELLCPLRVDERESKRRAAGLGSFRAAGQLQQRPAAREGAILKRGYWQFFPPQWLDDGERHRLPRFHALAQSWDTAFKDKSVNDYVCGGLWGLAGPNCYLLAVTKDRLSLSKTKQAIKDMTGWVENHERGWTRSDPAIDYWRTRLPMKILIENRANGPDVIRELRTELRGVIPWDPGDNDKTARANAAEPALEGGNVFVPGRCDPSLPSYYDPMGTPAFVQELIESSASFPFGEHDDDVDMMTMMVLWSRGAGRKARATLGRARGGPVEQGSFSGVV